MDNDVTIVQLPIPAAAMPMITAAARAYGWTPQIVTPQGEIDNPQSALEKILQVSIEMVRENAINIMAQQAADTARLQTRQELTTVVEDWFRLLNS